ncbi:hypothetical protein BpHYR1_014464 [Brachionus plicatilis]|uniref:Uncharacterized protein n=1 Tax=Brachionus plicatilis TaxID=10195 RepID=A0A3M7R0U5_BRAPC|nr:hypothetical protein BpHYR1_014464 [Brachionus plicatilis]
MSFVRIFYQIHSTAAMIIYNRNKRLPKSYDFLDTFEILKKSTLILLYIPSEYILKCFRQLMLLHFSFTIKF